MPADVVDFTSSNYLCGRHGHEQLPPWRLLTTGRPPVLGEPPRTLRLAEEVAGRTGRASALLETSALHAFIDGWAALAERPVAALVDEAAYPLGRIALRANGLPASTVRHFDPGHLVEKLREVAPGTRPVHQQDGLCPGCGRLAPLAEFVELLSPLDGVVLLDDTQAIGLAGTGPSGRNPYGVGGGGSARRLVLPISAPLLTVASTAKGLGVPLAVLAGPDHLVSAVRERGPCRVHASGPSSAAQAALFSALRADPAEVQRRRCAVAALVRLFRSSLRQHGLPPADGGAWPTQTVPFPAALCPVLHRALLHKGILTVVVRRRCRPGHGITFLINSAHTADDVVRAVRSLAEVCA